MNRTNLAFIVELMGLFILLIMVIVIITGVFVGARAASISAEQLNNAVIIAESTAETASAAADPDSLENALASMAVTEGNETVSLADTGSSVKPSEEGTGANEDEIIFFAVAGQAAQDGDPEGSGKAGAAKGNGSRYLVHVTRTAAPEGNGTYTEDVIDIYSMDPGAGAGSLDAAYTGLSDEPLYTLKSGNYFAGKEG